MDPSLFMESAAHTVGQAAVADTSSSAGQTVALQPLLAVLTVALGLSFTVERALQLVNRLLDRFFFRGDAPHSKARISVEQQIDELEQRLKEDKADRLAEEQAMQKRQADAGGLRAAEEKAAAQAPGARTIDAARLEQAENFSEATIIVEPATPPAYEKTNRAFWMQTFGALLGIGLCFYAKLGVFFKLFQFETTPALDRIDQLFTGILIGAGSQPVHFLINYLTQRKMQLPAAEGAGAPEAVSAEKATAPLALAAAPVVTRGFPPRAPVPITRAEEINVPYSGGVDRELLEHRHRRDADPDLIVCHHTSMHSDTSFADVVRIIRGKGWLTGYHCVVLKDGTIHAFCRWDRYGSHVQGYNFRSLGLALNGNFETDPKIPFANVGGRYGEPKPTDEQLHAAARVVALWSHLYGIPLDWNKSVRTHRELTPTRCPGSNFPLAEFRKLITHYHTQWSDSAAAREELELYRQKPYLFVKA